VIPVWVARFPPSQDLPNHLLEAYYLLDPGYAFVVKWDPIPYWTIVLILSALSRVIGWLAAGKVLLSLCVIAFIAGGHYLLTRVDQRLGVWSWLLGVLAYNAFFMSGIVNYYLGLGLSLFVIGYWYARQERRIGWGYWGMLALCTLLYFTHLIPFLMALLCTMISILVRSIERRQRLLSPLLLQAGSCFLPGLIAFAVYLAGHDEPSVIGPFPSLAERVFASIQAVLIQSVEAVPETVWPAVAQNGVRMAALVLLPISSAWSWLRARKDGRAPAAAPAGHDRKREQLGLFGCCFVLWLAVPTGVSDFLRFDQRLFPYVLLWGLCLLGQTAPAIRPLVRGTLAACACLCLVLTTLVFVRADQVFRRYEALFPELPSGGTVLSLTEYYPGPVRSPLEMLTPRLAMPYFFDCYYVLSRGGTYPAVFDIGPIGVQDIPVVTRKWDLGRTKRFDFTCRAFITEEMEALRQHYTIVFLWGEPCIDAGSLLGQWGYQWLTGAQEVSVWARGDVQAWNQ
jgi:hypothetical protein